MNGPGAGNTIMSNVSGADTPLALVTVSIALLFPGKLNLVEGFCALEELGTPPGKVHEYEIGELVPPPTRSINAP
jgi:hypothetical protein